MNALEWFARASVERFVEAIVAGGLSLVAGLWLTTLFDAGSPVWLAGVALVAVGIGALGAGIWSELAV